MIQTRFTIGTSIRRANQPEYPALRNMAAKMITTITASRANDVKTSSTCGSLQHQKWRCCADRKYAEYDGVDSPFNQYQKRPAFTESVKRARTLIEESMVKRSMGSSAAGVIFILKNMGYTDRPNMQTETLQIVISGKEADF